MKIETRKADGFAWQPVVRTEQGLAVWVSIYDRRGPDDLTEQELESAVADLTRVGYEWREVAKC